MHYNWNKSALFANDGPVTATCHPSFRQGHTQVRMKLAVWARQGIPAARAP